MSNLSQSLEDYLEAIYIFTKKKKVARVKDLSEFLEVKTPSVVGALKTLTKNKLVSHEHYGYIELTEAGLEIAQQVYEKHQIIFHFFHKILGVSKKISERDACALEHHIHAETYGRIIEFFEFLENCPDEQPGFVADFHDFLQNRTVDSQRKKQINMERYTILSSLKPGERGKIIKIDANVKIRKQLLSLGIIRNEIIEVIERIPHNQVYEYRIKESRLSLKKNEAESISVEVL